MSEELLRKLINQVATVPKAAGWAIVGEVVGNFLGLAIPDNIISDRMLGHLVGLLLIGLNALGLFARMNTIGGQALAEILLDVDELYMNNLLTHEEYKQLRLDAIKRFRRQIR